jgi:hypothetical protein
MIEASIPVFVGPSLSPRRRPTGGRFDWRPPAMAGDLLGFLDRPPSRLCLIDGLFDCCPAPWHKELLLLMAGGTKIFGAASMGALRAAELDRFGMIGVGAIYRAYRDGHLQGDDEVALIHATAGLDWVPLTVPMVEVRATLLAACRSRLITPATARLVRALVHDIHFTDRDWPAIEQACLEAGLMELALVRGIAALHVQLKERDALECLAEALLQADRASTAQPPPLTCFIRALEPRSVGLDRQPKRRQLRRRAAAQSHREKDGVA